MVQGKTTLLSQKKSLRSPNWLWFLRSAIIKLLDKYQKLKIRCYYWIIPWVLLRQSKICKESPVEFK